MGVYRGCLGISDHSAIADSRQSCRVYLIGRYRRAERHPTGNSLLPSNARRINKNHYLLALLTKNKYLSLYITLNMFYFSISISKLRVIYKDKYLYITLNFDILIEK